MSAQVEIIYFIGCPNAAAVFQTLKDNRIPFGITIQDRLPKDDAKRMLSSPSVLVNNVRVIGEELSEGVRACTASFSSETLLNSVNSALGTSKTEGVAE